jgi:16S rRNA (cytidine1402-2'-O)-methyltransferase
MNERDKESGTIMTHEQAAARLSPMTEGTASTPEPDRIPERRYFIDGTAVRVARAAPGLHVVATPIGNLGDITLRALATLAGTDLIACEDTRVTRKLLDRFGIATPLTPYHEHNAAAARPKLLQKLAEGAAIALVSDAGTPLISDPGFKLAREAATAGRTVIAVPGPSATLTALVASGLPTDQFLFAGFLPPKQAARRSRIAALARIQATLVLFETGPRIEAALADLAEGLGPRQAAICRELTKLHEEIRRGNLAALAAAACTAEQRGEFVIVIAPPERQPATEDCDTLLLQAMTRLSLKDAVGEVATVTGLSRRELYQRALALAKSEVLPESEVLAESENVAKANRDDDGPPR